MSYNKVILLGNLTRDPELRFTSKGTALATLSLAVSRKYQDREETTFVDCSAWGKTGETIAKHFKKGSSVLIEGRLKLDQWDDKQTGQKRSKLGVVVESFSFAGREPAQEPEPAEPRRAETKPDGPPEDDVPF